MSHYSLGGYAIALQARSGGTVLVEGKDDKSLLERLKVSESGARQELLIDSADIFRDTALAGFGNKQKIDCFLHFLHAYPGASRKLRALVDREWEGLMDAAQEITSWSALPKHPMRYVSMGHSIENYSFSVTCVIDYLKHFGGDVASADNVDRIVQEFPSILSFATAVSETCSRREVITRFCGIVQLQHLQFVTPTWSFSESLVPALTSRHIDDPLNFVAEVNHRFVEKWLHKAGEQEIALLSHGHIGEMLVWACCGKLLEYNGVNTATCAEFAYGRRDERRRFWHNWLANLPSDQRAPLAELLLDASAI